ncbi:MAG: class I SAM-dependent rRNA methyltransferase [Pseudomonadota bacterium]
MKQTSEICLKPNRDVPVRAGHPWIFSNAIERAPDINAGSIVKVVSSSGVCLGIGFYNPNTSIRVRIISRYPDESINADFFVKRFKDLDAAKRKFLPPDTDGFRLVNSDADWLPGLIVDCYRDVFVFQVHSAGMENFKSEIVDALKKSFDCKAIIERSDVGVRKIEGLPAGETKVHFGDVESPVEFLENGVKFFADVLHGHKTGFYLDQRDARSATMSLSRGKRVLNLFGYTGGFSIYAALGGAKEVTTVDVSNHALELAVKNFQFNGLKPEEYKFIEADVFDFLSDVKTLKGKYDLIVCDPPAFTKSFKNVPQALKTYTTLNRSCLELLEPGGIMITSSCSGVISEEEFSNSVRIAAGQSKRDVVILDRVGQPFDHTQRLAFPEGRYLKTMILEVVKKI